MGLLLPHHNVPPKESKPLGTKHAQTLCVLPYLVPPKVKIHKMAPP